MKGVENFVFVNHTLTKPDTDRFVLALSDRYGAHTLAPVLDTIKALGFHYSTQAGRDDLEERHRHPARQGEDPRASTSSRVEGVHAQYDRGLITEDERHETIVNIWTEATDTVAEAMQANLDELNPVFMMANSGARGSFKQIRQLAGMRGLMANPKGEIIERPIKANFMEGLSVLEYFISTHGARKGLADTALRTADSGYLTRRLVDVSQDVIVREEDCGTEEYVELPVRTQRGAEQVAARTADRDRRLQAARVGQAGQDAARRGRSGRDRPRCSRSSSASSARRSRCPVRSVVKCRAETGVCQSCYGIFLATGEMCEIGDAIGIVAAQSIGEPGTQLTMRTFHTGGVAGADITHGLPRVVEIFEARNPKGAATLAEVGGRIEVEQTERGPKLTLDPDRARPRRRARRPGRVPAAAAYPPAGRQTASSSSRATRSTRARATRPTCSRSRARRRPSCTSSPRCRRSTSPRASRSTTSTSSSSCARCSRRSASRARERPSCFPASSSTGSCSSARTHGPRRRSKEPATFEPLILGITKASLATESFLSAASFQETTKVLTDASIEGKIDRLLGLKENVIIGKLIPAATGLRRYRQIEIGPDRSGRPGGAYPQDTLLLQALEEIGNDGGSLTFASDLETGFDGELGPDDLGDAGELPEVDSPLDD